MVIVLLGLIIKINFYNTKNNIEYVDSVSGYSIILPEKWIVKESDISTSTSNTWFYDSSDLRTDNSIRMSVSKFQRTDKMNEVISNFGTSTFVEAIVNGLRSDSNLYSTVSTSSIRSNGKEFYQTISKYTGSKSKKEVIQYIHLILIGKAYYLIGVDSYTDVWEKNKEKLLNSVQTFKLN